METIRTSARRARRGFTLVELLVVIAIISILAALLLPALEQAMHAARKTACLANIRQLNVHISNYTSSYADWLMKTYTRTGYTDNTGKVASGLGQLCTGGIVTEPSDTPNLYCPSTPRMAISAKYFGEWLDKLYILGGTNHFGDLIRPYDGSDPTYRFCCVGYGNGHLRQAEMLKSSGKALATYNDGTKLYGIGSDADPMWRVTRGFVMCYQEVKDSREANLHQGEPSVLYADGRAKSIPPVPWAWIPRDGYNDTTYGINNFYAGWTCKIWHWADEQF